ncbi:NAD(P)-binding protein [Mollisia scopiformis]|uniref:NAD(P)-binding protein n=1 Tax=Mollisia scopiformis TaxID=149040 RepID=A0A194XLV0_MOLSC|nr:NAD(P)-binding protein [Mollisia scopiformis]KUJ20742.1 NAD(P)-binding protein [Mollisia scopiformis]
MPEFTPDQVAFVTGAASGIGLAISKQLILDGITKIAALDISESGLSTAFESSSAKVLQLVVDCSSESEIEAAVEKTVAEFGRLDVCVNAAGIPSAGPRVKIDELEKGNTEKVLELNLMGVWLCERAQIRQFLKQEMRHVSTGLPLKTRGSIVNLGSLTSHVAIPALSPYIMAKHGVLGLTKADAHDYALEGIRVNCICPGWIRTQMTSSLRDNPEVSEAVVTRAPMARWGHPEEIAFTASFLLSDKASFVTGASISVDGGYGAC